MPASISQRIENTFCKRENAVDSPFPTLFSKAIFLKVIIFYGKGLDYVNQASRDKFLLIEEIFWRNKSSMC